MILKKHVGRPVDFKGSKDFGIINGRIEAVARRFATIRYWSVTRNDGKATFSQEGFTVVLPVNSPAIVAVH